MLSFPAWSPRGVDIRRNLLEPTPTIEIRELERQVVEEPLRVSINLAETIQLLLPTCQEKKFKPDTSYCQLTKDHVSHAQFPVRQRQPSTAKVTDGSTTAENDGKVATHESIFHQTIQ